MRYRYRLWCHDCTDEDPQGCFDGGTQTSEETFDTPGEAADAGADYVDDVGPWDYEVIDEEGDEVEVED